MASLRVLSAVRDDQLGALTCACVFVFSLLAGNYLIRPVRDAMAIAGGTDHLPERIYEKPSRGIL
jgi:ATP:ADP antiporter, AAA family